MDDCKFVGSHNHLRGEMGILIGNVLGRTNAVVVVGRLNGRRSPETGIRLRTSILNASRQAVLYCEG